MLERNMWETPTVRSPATTISAKAGQFQHALFTFRRHLRALAAWVLICVAAAAVYLAVVPPEYSATAYVVLKPGQTSVNSPSPAGFTPAATLDNSQVETQVALATSENVLRFVFDERRLQNDPELLSHPSWPRRLLSRFIGKPGAVADRSDDLAFATFVNKVSARRVGQSYVLGITFQSRSAARAASMANSIIAAYIRDQIYATMLSLRSNGALLQGRMDDIKSQQEQIAEAVRSGLPPNVQFPASDARIISSAEVPFAKSYPQSALILAGAFAFSLLTGIGVISISHALHQKVRTRKQVGRELYVDCLAVIPKLKRIWGVPALATTLKLALGESNPFADSVRELRACVIDTDEGNKPRIIGIVSTVRGEGKSAISAGLARCLSLSGRKTALVDADLHTGSLTRLLAPDSPGGLRGGLCTQNFEQVLTQVSTFFFVPAGSDREFGKADERDLPVDVPAALVKTLQSFDYVIIDLSALDSYSEIIPFAPILESCVIVAESGRCYADEVRGTIESLARLNVKVLGAVVNKQSKMDASKP